ncbi:MAG TPA: hypothetical protein V6D22_20695 [Candidatus Obscuribacterales bacterium]
MRTLSKNTSFNKATSALLALGFAVSQTAALAQVVPATAALPSTPPTEANQQVDNNQPLIAQTAGTTVLQGRISNVDSLSRDILRSEIKLEKFNLNYRLNAAKQGRWKGWRYFFFQESKLALAEAGLIKSVEYRGRHLHSGPLSPALYGPAVAKFTGNRHTNRAPIIVNGTIVPGIISFFMGDTGDAIELGINMWHSWQASRHGFSQTQSRKYVAGLIADIDKKLADREAAIRQEPTSDAELAQLQQMEGKVLTDFRDVSVSEFERFHIGASRVLARENSFYLLDMARTSLGIYNNWMAASFVIRKHNRGIGVFSITSTIISSMIMLDPILARVAGSAAARMDRRSLESSGLPRLVESPAKLKSDYSALSGFAASHRTSDKPAVAAAISRLDTYDANHNYYTNEIQKNASALRRGQRAAIQNMGMGVAIGGTRLVQGVIGDYITQYHQHVRGPATWLDLTTHKSVTSVLPPNGHSVLIANGSPKQNPNGTAGGAGVWQGRQTNEWLYTSAVVYLAGISTAIIDSWRIRLSSELAYQRQKSHHSLPGQVIRARLAQLDQMEAKI